MHTCEDKEPPSQAAFFFVRCALARVVSTRQLRIQAVDRPDHRVSEPVSSRRKFDGYKGIFTPFVKGEARRILPDGLTGAKVWKDVMDNLLATDFDQEVVDHNPLVVPANLLLDFLKRCRLIRACEFIVKPQHRRVQLRDDDIFVVALVADQRPPG